MKKGRIVLLILMWTATLTLFAVPALSAAAQSVRERPPMTGSETDYTRITPESAEENGGQPQKSRRVRISGCLSESEMAKRLLALSDGITDSVTVKAGTDTLTVYTALTADAETVAEKYPQAGADKLTLTLMKNAPIEISAKMKYEKKSGLSVSDTSVAVYGVELSESDASALCDMLVNGLRSFLEDPKTDWQTLELLPGGLYYTCVADEEDADRIFKVKDENNG